MKNLLTLVRSGEKNRKIEALRKSSFGDSSKHALSLQKEFKRFNYCGYQATK